MLARNRDDHMKDIAFLMDKRGRWSLAPAFDVMYAYNPSGDWTASHQMTVNGKRDDFSLSEFAERAGIEEARAARIRKVLRLDLPAG